MGKLPCKPSSWQNVPLKTSLLLMRDQFPTCCTFGVAATAAVTGSTAIGDGDWEKSASSPSTTQ
jgi:hypothetical protein